MAMRRYQTKQIRDDTTKKIESCQRVDITVELRGDYERHKLKEMRDQKQHHGILETDGPWKPNWSLTENAVKAMKNVLAQSDEGRCYAERISGHSFRRSRITHLVRHDLVHRNMSPQLLLKIAGHRSLDMTYKYIDEKNLGPLSLEEGVVAILSGSEPRPPLQRATRGWPLGKPRGPKKPIERPAAASDSPKCNSSTHRAAYSRYDTEYRRDKPHLTPRLLLTARGNSFRYGSAMASGCWGWKDGYSSAKLSLLRDEGQHGCQR